MPPGRIVISPVSRSAQRNLSPNLEASVSNHLDLDEPGEADPAGAVGQSPRLVNVSVRC